MLGLVGLGVVVVVAIFFTIGGLDEEADAMERVGNLRMGAQRAALLAEKVARAEDGKINAALRTELAQLTEQLTADSRWLLNNPAVPGEVGSLLATAWDAQAGVMAKFANNLRAVLDGKASADTLRHREVMLFGDEVARRYRQHAIGELRGVKWIAGIGFLVLLLGLLGLYLLVLRSAVQRVELLVRRQTNLSEAIVQSGHGVLLLDDHGSIGFANSYAEMLAGYALGGMAGLSFGRLLYSSYGENVAETVLAATVRPGGSWHGDLRIVRHDSTPIWVEMVVTATATEAGYLVIFFDATQRREAEAKLRQARERLVTAIEAVDDGFALFDADERLLLCNRKYPALMPQLEPWITQGVTMTTLLEQMWKLGLVDTDLALDQFVALRMAQFRAGLGKSELRLTDGRTLRAQERRTPEGGRVCVLGDVTLVNSNRDQLRYALRQAEAASRSKTVFLSSMSHELRTPLHAILGFAQLLEGTADDCFGPSQRRSVGHILSAGRKLTALIDQVLQLADLEAGRLLLDNTSFDWAEVVQDGVAAVADDLRGGGLELEVSGCDLPLPVMGDAGRMAEVVAQLLSNAIKFNRPQGRVAVSLRGADKGWARLSVADSGRGIAPAVQSALFQPFNRLGEEGSAIEGTGIGLTIARALVERMGGRIGFSSVEGQGSTFWVDLRLATAQTAAPCRGRILYVDDNAETRQVMTQAATANPGLDLQMVHDYAAAERLIQSNPGGFDLVVVSLQANSRIAEDFCQRLHQNQSTRLLPVVACVGGGQGSQAPQVALGFDDYLHQPVAVDAVVEMINRYCLPSDLLVR